MKSGIIQFSGNHSSIEVINENDMQLRLLELLLKARYNFICCLHIIFSERNDITSSTSVFFRGISLIIKFTIFNVLEQSVLPFIHLFTIIFNKTIHSEI